MKTHAIIPIFLPHRGCPHACTFCNQRTITARSQPLSLEQIEETIKSYLSTISAAEIPNTEIAFFGGSFTGLPIEQQREYLAIAKKYKDEKRIKRIRLSTRPDYIDEKILSHLKDHSVDLIELGVQSFDPEVLELAGRGHDIASIYESSELIKKWGFQLGIQLMIGLPGASYDRDLFSAEETVKIAPSVARLYPTVILEGTALFDQYQEGAYHPPSLEEMVRTTKDMYLVLQSAGIQIIRVGLKSTNLIQDTGTMADSGYHPAFRQLVEGEIAKEKMESQLINLLHEDKPSAVDFFSCGASFSNMVGNRKCNRAYFTQKYPEISFGFRVRKSLSPYTYLAEKKR